jgi:hypothetical protein
MLMFFKLFSPLLYLRAERLLAGFKPSILRSVIEWSATVLPSLARFVIQTTYITLTGDKEDETWVELSTVELAECAPRIWCYSQQKICLSSNLKFRPKLLSTSWPVVEQSTHDP